MSVQRRVAMFRRGTQVAERFNEAWAGKYACPMCMSLFTEADAVSGVLSEEHVPPESLGGDVLLLTCSSCNSTSGHLLDQHMLLGDQLVTLGTEHASRLSAVGTFGNVTQRGEAHFTGDSFLFVGVGQQNRPETPAAVVAEIDALNSTDGLHGTFSFRLPLNERLARIGWMRVAYLVAFCQFGYSVITSPPYERLRQQILDPDAAFIDPRIVTIDRNADRSHRAIAIPEQPVFREALIIVCGWYSVIVPRPDASHDFFERVVEGFTALPPFEWSGRAADWPSQLLATLDGP